MSDHPDIVYKICDRNLWTDAENSGVFKGAEIDIADGFIHFSTAGQVASTLKKHFSERRDLLLIAVDAGLLGERIVYERARGDMLFPHLYQPLDMQYVLWVKALPLGEDGTHQIPDMSR